MENDCPARSLEDFIFEMPKSRFVFLPTGERWHRAGVDAYLPPVNGVKASVWLEQYRTVFVPLDEARWSSSAKKAR
jgi:hypothetical protein